jgi:hypothetical protein
MARASLVVCGAVLWTAGVVGAAERPALERFTAFAVNMSNVSTRQRAGSVDIVIERWSSDAERDRLVSALVDKGPSALLRELQKVKLRAGFIRSATSIGYDLQFAREVPGEEGGRRIVIATDRPISFFEQSRQPRSIDYPFMLIEMRLDKNGEGEGKLAVASKITFNKAKNAVEIENYANEPVLLTKITKVR